MAFPSLSQLFPSVYKPETCFCLVFECSPQFRSQNLSLSFQHLIFNFKHSYRNVKYFGIVPALQNISWARTLSELQRKKLVASSLLVSQCLTTLGLTQIGRGVEVYSIHINTLFEAWVRHWSFPVLFSSKLRAFFVLFWAHALKNSSLKHFTNTNGFPNS